MKILGIETSCDETASALVENGTTILSATIASSSEFQQKYGGVVPEIAARKQAESMIPVLTETLTTNYKLLATDIDAIAVTIGPGLIGSLLVGVETAKTLSLVWNKPLIPVNHVHAHIYANFIQDYHPVIPGLTRDPLIDIDSRFRGNDKKIVFPAIALVASGGHTELFYMKDIQSLKWLGGTLDDAAGECFDKVAKLLGLPYPGGPAIAAQAEKFSIHNSQFAIKFPRPMMYEDNLNFSFSGLKTAVIREVNKLKTMKQWSNETMKQFAFEVQEAITDVLVHKTIQAAKQYKTQSILLSGGVAANTKLKEKFSIFNSQFSIGVPPPSLCTDNAAAIAAYAYFHHKPVDWRIITAQPNLSVEV